MLSHLGSGLQGANVLRCRPDVETRRRLGHDEGRGDPVVLIVTIAFGIAALRIAAYALWPFGRTIVRRADAGAASATGNVLWIVRFGWWLALEHLLTGIALCITIIGIPLGLANFKLSPISFTPLGREIVSTHGSEESVRSAS